MSQTGNNDGRWKRDAATKVYSVPRRYDLATLFAVSIAYSLAFGVMRLCHCPAAVFGVLTSFVTCVGLGQALLLKGKSPRTASVLVGVAFWAAGAVLVAVSDSAAAIPDALVTLPPLLFIVAILGALTGYIAGVAVGGVFLIADQVRQLARRVVDRQR